MFLEKIVSAPITVMSPLFGHNTKQQQNDIPKWREKEGAGAGGGGVGNDRADEAYRPSSANSSVYSVHIFMRCHPATSTSKSTDSEQHSAQQLVAETEPKQNAPRADSNKKKLYCTLSATRDWR